MIKLTNEQLERYSRHIILSQVGGFWQKKILSSKVLIIGRAKIESGRETINALKADVQVHTYNEQVTAANIRDIIKDLDYDFIIDGTDNFPAKFNAQTVFTRGDNSFSRADDDLCAR